jgi:hypothetical protein
MSGDFSRLTWDRRKHYTAVLMQQGRLQLDADWNEQIDIIMHRLGTEAADYLGHSAVPARAPDGFRIEPPDPKATALRVAPGRIYVEGRLFENEDPLDVPLADLLPGKPKPGPYVVYVDTWQRHVTFVEDPDIREVALGGPDTATRLQNDWRIRMEATTDKSPAAYGPEWRPAAPEIGAGLLNVRVTGDQPTLENQLYRVEAHSVTDDDVRFTWSRDNGSVVTAVTGVQAAGRAIGVAGAGRDREAAFAARQWVEVLTEAQVLGGERGVLVRIDHADDRQVVITEESWPWSDDAVPELYLMRRWDDPSGLVTAPMDGSWVPLENGIEVSFEPGPDTGAVAFVPGDYWLIPARSATASITWPSDRDGPTPQPPQGVHHTYAALALLILGSDGTWSMPTGGDLRPVVSPLDEGFVSKAGDTVRGPLSVSPLLSASRDDQELVALDIAPTFDDAGHQRVSRAALRVTGGPVVFGSAGRPVETTANGALTVSGALTANGALTVGGALTANGALTVSGKLTVSGDLEVGGLAITGGVPPDAGFLRFGDNSGSKLYLARAREGSSAPPNTGTQGVFATVTDGGRLGLGTTTPIARLHVAANDFIALTGISSQNFDPRGIAINVLQDGTTPNNTLLIGGVYDDHVELYWKNGQGTIRTATITAAAG